MEGINRGLEISKLMKEIMFHVKNNIGKEVENAGLPGITPTQGMLLGLLSRHGDMKVSEISRMLGLNNSTVSGIIDRLEKQELVERLRSEEDKRVVYIRHSPRMKGMESKMHSKLEGIVERVIIKKGTTEDFEKIIEGLNTLKRLLTDTDRS